MTDAEARKERKRTRERTEDQAQRAAERKDDLATAEVIQAGAAVQAHKLATVAEEMVQAAHEQTETLREQIRKAAIRPLILWTVATALILLTVGIAVAIGFAINAASDANEARDIAKEQLKISQSNAKLLSQGAAILALIKDCTDPAGTCAKNGQKTTGDAIVALNTFQVIVGECTDAYDGDGAIETCIGRKAREKGLVPRSQ